MARFAVGEIAIFAVSISDWTHPLKDEEVTVVLIGNVKGADGRYLDYAVAHPCIKDLVPRNMASKCYRLDVMAVYDWQLRKRRPPEEPMSLVRSSKTENEV